jgi:amidohydrolase
MQRICKFGENKSVRSKTSKLFIRRPLVYLRRELHKYPELSGVEKHTVQRIKYFLEEHHPGRFVEELGGNGLAVVYDFTADGPTVMIRCELDALPILEENSVDYKSVNKGVSHKCGHDGHMAIVAGIALWLKDNPMPKGRVVLLFQPAEETGKGAYDVLQNIAFRELNPDYIYGLHNIPGEPLHRVLVMDKYFSAEVKSMSIKLLGKDAHAAEPENGINPALAISEMICELDKLNVNVSEREDFSVLTPVHFRLG